MHICDCIYLYKTQEPHCRDHTTWLSKTVSIRLTRSFPSHSSSSEAGAPFPSTAAYSATANPIFPLSISVLVDTRVGSRNYSCHVVSVGVPASLCQHPAAPLGLSWSLPAGFPLPPPTVHEGPLGLHPCQWLSFVSLMMSILIGAGYVLSFEKGLFASLVHCQWVFWFLAASLFLEFFAYPRCKF